MIVLAVLLLLVVAAVVLFVVVTGITPTVTLDWSLVNTQVTLTALALFLLGAATLLVAETGLALLLRGNRKNWERRRELKHLRRAEAERARHEGTPGVSSGTPTSTPTSTAGRPAPTMAPSAAQPAAGTSTPTAPTTAKAPDRRTGSRGGAEGSGSSRV